MNQIHIEDPADDVSKYFCGMQIRLLSVLNACTNFINYGVCAGGHAPIPERKHLNNVAHLSWRLIHNETFAREMALYDPVLAEEHRMLLSRFGAVFNRIPRVFARATPKDQYTMEVSGESFAYGREFAREFTFPYFEQKFGQTGKFPLLKGVSTKPASTLQFVNSVRRYTISMLNAASILVVKEQVSYKNLMELLAKEEKLWGRAATADDIVKAANEWIQKHAEAGRSDIVQRVMRNRDLLLGDAARVNPESAKLRDDLNKVRAELDESFQKFEKRVAQQPQKVLDALKSSNPAVVYGVQSFEIFVKWAVAISAWNVFRESAGKVATEPWWAGKGMQAAIKGLDAGGSTLQFLGLHKVLSTAWLATGKGEASAIAARLEVLGKVGKGMCAAADIGSAVVYSYDIFVTGSYGDSLLENYLPENATTMYGFHLVTWAGKSMVGLGSGGGFFKALPVFAVLQGIGYLAQLIGEVGEKFAEYGAGEHKHFHDVHQALLDATRGATNEVVSRGWKADFYPQEFRDDVHTFMNNFKWMPVDPLLFRARLAPAA
jgi:hypothetical protein